MKDRNLEREGYDEVTRQYHPTERWKSRQYGKAIGVGAGVIAGLATLMAIIPNRQVKPIAHYDLDGDGQEEVFVEREVGLNSYDIEAYSKDAFFKDKEGNLRLKKWGFMNQLEPYMVRVRRPEDKTWISRTYEIGDFDGDGKLDLKVVDEPLALNFEGKTQLVSNMFRR